MNFWMKSTKSVHKLDEDLFFRDHKILEAGSKNPSLSAPQTSEETTYVPRPEQRHLLKTTDFRDKS